jgi:RES domain-containing protein
VNLWRISNHQSLNGEGGRRAPARWHSGGEPIVYLAASAAGALLEILAHLELTEVSAPRTYTLLRISVPDRLKIPTLTPPEGENWKADEALTRKLGDAWLKSRESALALVPSSILPDTFNYLLNPLHPDATRIAIAEVHTAILDPRLVR